MGMMTRHNRRTRAVEQAALVKKKPIDRKELECQGGNLYTKTDINTMKVSDLRKVATRQGIQNADDISGAELKNLLIAKLGL